MERIQKQQSQPHNDEMPQSPHNSHIAPLRNAGFHSGAQFCRTRMEGCEHALHDPRGGYSALFLRAFFLFALFFISYFGL